MNVSTSNAELAFGYLSLALLVLFLVLFLYAIFFKPNTCNENCDSGEGAGILLLFVIVVGIVGIALSPVLWLISLFKKPKA